MYLSMYSGNGFSENMCRKTVSPSRVMFSWVGVDKLPVLRSVSHHYSVQRYQRLHMTTDQWDGAKPGARLVEQSVVKRDVWMECITRRTEIWSTAHTSAT